MHAIQTRGNCVRNITSDQFAGVAADEIVDPRPWCELMRQWSTLHPEFAFLPRKFKIAVTGATADRAAMLVHDIGVQAVRNDARRDVGFRVIVGGGQGRTPIIGHVIREFLPAAELLTYFDAILRVYNRYGRRDNKYKARIKILVKELTPAEFTRQVEAEWERAARRPRHRARGGDRADRRALHRPAVPRLRRATASPIAPRSPTAGRSRAGPSATCGRTSARATRSSRCR